MSDEQEIQVTEQQDEHSANGAPASKKGVSSIITSLGGGVGIAAILGVIVQLIQPSLNQPAAVVDSNPTPTDVAASTTDSSNISGIWQGSSDWGDITLQQDGSKVSGSYTYVRGGNTIYGQIEGQLIGTAYSFNWWEGTTENSSYEEAEVKGTGNLTLNNNQLVGRWQVDGSKDQRDLVLTRQ